MIRTVRIETKLTSAFLFLALLLGVCATAQAQKPEQLAQQSSDAWLALVDSGKYADSWQEAAQPFKAAVTKEQWQSALGTVRTPLGKLQSRKLKERPVHQNAARRARRRICRDPVRHQLRTQAISGRDDHSHAR